MKKLTPYGATEHARAVSKVGKSKTPMNLARRMPSSEIAAKVGPVVGVMLERPSVRTRRVVRLNAEAAVHGE